MKLNKFIAVFISVLMLISALFGVVVSADTEPTEGYIITDPTYIEEPVTDYTEPTDHTDVYTEPTCYTEYTEATEPVVTEFVRPTEYPENYQPNTHSNYVSPQPAYVPAEQDFNEVAWEKIELDISSGNAAGIGDFSNIKNNTSRGDSNNYTLLVVGIILITLAVAGATFAILYNPKLLARKAGVKQSAPGAGVAKTESKRKSSADRNGRDSRRTHGTPETAVKRRKPSLEQQRSNYDEYNDGF